MSDFEINVRAPLLTGRKYLVQWWNESEQGHVIVADSIPGALHTLGSIIKNEEFGGVGPATAHMSFRAGEKNPYWEVDVVSPPDWLLEGMKLCDIATKREDFRGWVFNHLLTGGDISDLKECKKGGHSNCKNCFEGYCIPGKGRRYITVDEAYSVLREDYEGELRRHRPEGAPSLAPKGIADQPLYAVLANHWDHSEGTYINKVKTPDDKWKWIGKAHHQPFGSGTLLFFFQGKPIAIPEADEFWAVEQRLRAEEEKLRVEQFKKDSMHHKKVARLKRSDFLKRLRKEN